MSRRILVVAPHADDETLGVGGTIARHVAQGDHVSVAIMTGKGEGKHPVLPSHVWEVVREEAKAALDVLGVQQVLFDELPAVCVAETPMWQVNQSAMEILKKTKPEVIYVPFLFDMHRDHRELFHAFSVGWRPHSSVGRSIREVYTYEVPSETHWNFHNAEGGFLPNVYVDISATLEKKMEAWACYTSQHCEPPHPRSAQAIEALAVVRGSNVGLKAAEAFMMVRQII